MGFLDSRIDRLFDKTADGRYIYYPSWIFQKGVIVSEEAANQLKKLTRISYGIAYCFVFIMLISDTRYPPGPPLIPELLIGFLMIYYFIEKMLKRKYLRNAEVYPSTLKQRIIIQSKKSNVAQLYFSLIVISALIVWFTYNEIHSPHQHFFGFYMFLVVWGVMTAYILALLYYRKASDLIK